MKMKRWRFLLPAILMASGTVATTASASDLACDDKIISDPLVSLPDPEFDPFGSRIVWQDLDKNLWVADIDPDTGDLVPTSGQGTLIDTNLASFAITHNGPEWAFGGNDPYIVYTKFFEPWTFLAAAREVANGEWRAQLLQEGYGRFGPFGTPRSNIGSARINYQKILPDTGLVLAWRKIYDPDSERTLPDVTSIGGRWDETGESLVTTIMIDGVRQVVLVDAETGGITQLTFKPIRKALPYMWFAPEFGEIVFLTLLGPKRLGIFRKVGEEWVNIYTIVPPSDKPFIGSPEPFVFAGKSYVSFTAAKQIIDRWPYAIPIGPTELWFAAVDPASPMFRRVDCRTPETRRIDPEPFITNQGPFIYYTEQDEATGIYFLGRAATGL